MRTGGTTPNRHMSDMKQYITEEEEETRRGGGRGQRLDIVSQRKRRDEMGNEGSGRAIKPPVEIDERSMKDRAVQEAIPLLSLIITRLAKHFNSRVFAHPRTSRAMAHLSDN